MTLEDNVTSTQEEACRIQKHEYSRIQRETRYPGWHLQPWLPICKDEGAPFGPDELRRGVSEHTYQYRY